MSTDDLDKLHRNDHGERASEASPRLERDGVRVRVVGPGGTYHHPDDLSPGYLPSDPSPFGNGPGGTISFEANLYDDGTLLTLEIVEVIRVYGQECHARRWESGDRGASFQRAKDDTRTPPGERIGAIDFQG